MDVDVQQEQTENNHKISSRKQNNSWLSQVLRFIVDKL